MRIAAQAFTIRRELAGDAGAAFARLRDAGYSAVELAGLAGRSATEIAEALDSAGIAAVAMHVSLDALRRNLDAVADDARAFGLAHVVVPSLADDQHSWELTAYRRAAAELDGLAVRLADGDLHLHVHNHAIELTEIDGVRPLELLVEGAGEHVRFELDVGWVRVAGEDPVAWMRRLAGRLTFVHLKDVAFDDRSHTFRPLGAGVIDWAEVLATCREVGVDWGIVEDDDALEGPYASLEQSLDHLAGLGHLS